MKFKGIKRGQIIELLQEVDIPDDTEITLEFNPSQSLSETERLTRLNQLFGSWQNQPELDETFAEIDRERHAYRGREIASLD
ncbi:hypothetical protein [Floridanema evergladense]|uniref:Uncharacterized protein n=1 Tax=Floridaenema evergladense BLCC-F167 TaxID=3153639 RepID=A0ABV4WMV3_9CYAN